MNKNLFCILYNAAKGGWVVVRESALSKGAARYCGCIPMLVRCASVLVVVLHPPLAVLAQVVAATGAPPANQPVVGAADNGTPMVQIAAPNPAGLSNNHYSEFNVGERGLILNNATGGAATQLGGAVAGNDLLGGRSAAVILNQVVGTGQSRFEGILEVAGQRADVIIANPNGIVCNGGSFINTSRGVLTTGLPILGAGGGLDGFRVGGGRLEVGIKGLNARNIDQVDLIARSLQVNGQIHAGGALNVITGPNRVGYDGLVHVLPDVSGAPKVSVDVGLLGGMYARKIHLIGTETGVGVNNQGILAAQDGFTCTQQGRIVLTGKTAAGGDLALASQSGISNSGTVYAQGNTTLTSAETIHNTGTLAAQGNLSLQAAQVDSRGDLGAGIGMDGRCLERGDLEIKAHGTLMATGQNLAGGHLNFGAAQLAMGGASTAAGGNITLTATGGIEHQGASLHAGGVLKATGAGLANQDGAITQAGKGETRIDIRGPIDNSAGMINTNANKFHLRAFSLHNRDKGEINHAGTGLMSLQACQVHNVSGLISSNGKLGFSATRDIDNAGGTIQASDLLRMQGRNIFNDAGLMLSRRSYSVVAEKQLRNAPGTTATGAVGGMISGKGDGLIHADHIVNSGTLEADPNLWVEAKTMVNSGLVAAAARLEVKADSLNNRDGHLLAPTLGLNIPQLDNTNGEVAADVLRVVSVDLTNTRGKVVHLGPGTMNLELSGALVNTEGGLIQSNGAGLKLEPKTLDNSGGTIAHAGTGTLSLQIGDSRGALANQAGTIITGGSLDIGAASIGNQGGVLLAREQALLTATQGGIDNGPVESKGATEGKGGLISADRVRMVAGQGTLLNQDGKIEASQGVNLFAKKLDNTDGKVLNTGEALLEITVQEGLGNERGLIDSKGMTRVNASTVDNAQGQIASAQGLKLKAGALTGDGILSGGSETHIRLDGDYTHSARNVIASRGDLTLETRGTLTNAGKLQSPGMLKVSGVAVHNQPSGSIQGQKLKVALSHEFTNSGSLIAAEGLNIEAKTIDNARGSIQAGTDLEVKSEGAVTNQGGRMNAGGPKAGDSKLRVIATSIDNTSGVVANAGTGDSTITGSSRITNSNEGKDPALGRITGEGKVIVSTADLRNTQGGRLAAGADLTVSGVGHVNNSGGTIQAQGLLSLNEPAATVTNTRGGKLTAAGNVTLNVASIDNSDGAIGTATGGSGAVHISAPLTVTNANGRIVSAQDLTVIAGSVEGKGEVMGGNDTILTLTGDGKRPSESRITAKRNLTLTAVNEWKNAGSLGAGGIVTAKASVLHNQGSAVIEGKTSQITATENLINEGRITGETVALEAVSGRIDNKGGRVDGNSALTVTADQLHNTGGVLALRGTRAPEGAVPEDKQGLKIKVQKMDNSSGYVRNLGDQAFTVTADTELINDRGTLYGLGPVDVTAGRIVNTLGQLQGSSVLTVKSKGELKNEGGLLDGRDRLVAEAKGAISNQGGRIVVGEDASGPSRLEVSAESIDNRGGRIANAGTGDSIVTGSSLISNNNESKDPDLGLITGHGKLTVHTADLRNTQGGYLTAGADLTLSGVRDLDNSGGTVRAQGALSLKEEAAIVTNTGGGKLTAAGNVTLQVASIDNRHGEIGTAEGGSGTVQITAPIKVANAGGRLVSAHDLTVRAGSVEGKGEITGGNDTTLTLIGDGTESSENRITAGHNLTLTATKTWKNAGSLRAPGTVAVVADEFLNQHSGLLSAGTVQITGTQKLTNEGKGQILGKSVTLQSDREIVNDGTVISQGNATLTSKGVIHNAETGTLSAQRDLEINAAEIVSKGDLGAGLSGDGAAVNPGNLKLTATHQLKVTGQSLAGGDLTFTGPSLMLPGATAQAGNITLVANGGDIMHQGGQLHARGAFRATATSLFNQHGTITEAGHGDNELKISGTINNESGIIASNARNLTVESSSLSNGLGGKLHHGGTGLLNLKQTGELSNAKGVLSSNGDATITAGTLNNEAGLLTAKKAITVEHTEDLQNRSGVIEAGSSLELAGRTVTNDGGRMVALGGQARIKDVIQLNNTAGTTFQGSIGGLVSGSTDTIIDAGRVNNIGGTIVADGDLTFRETKELHNSGTLSAGGGLKAHAGVLNNTRGNMTARSLDLRGSQLDNSAGELTATTLSGTVTDLINSNGKLTHQGTEPMGLAVTGTLVNTHGGQIRSNGDLLLRPEVLDNTSGTIVSSGTMAVVASVIQNHKGTLHADTSLDVRSGGTLVNEGGTLATKGNLVVQSVGILDNEAGRLQAGAGGVGNTLQVTGYVVHNAGGRIANDGTGDSTITGQHLILNSNASGVPDLGVIGGQGGVTITTAELKNNQGGQLFAGGVLALDTPKLDNTGGRAHAQVNLAMTRPGSTVENARGEMSAGGDVRLTLASLVNTEGKVVAGQDLDLTNPTLPVDGLLTAGRDASYTLQGDFQQPEGKILSAKRNLTLATTGGLTNAGSLEAGGRLILSADNIFNRASGLMYGEAALVAAKGSLKNLGKIYGTDIALDAKTIINGHLDKPPVDRFKVPTARTGLFGLFPKAALAQLNQPLQPESKAQSGVVAAHRSLQIGADTVSNEGPDTLLSSGGDLAIGGHLDEKHLAVGESVRIDNHSGTIQAVEGDMRLESKAINNLNDNFATAQVVKSSEKVNLYEAMDNPVGPLGKKYLESELKPANWGPHGATGCWYSAVGDFDGKVRLWNGYIDTDKDGRGHFSDYIKYEVTRTITCTEVARTTPGSILAGGNMNLAAGQILNDKSRIIAGKDLTFPKGHLSNTEVKGTRVTEDKGIHYFSRPGARAPWSVFGGYRAAPFSETIPKTMEVVASVHEARTRPSAKPVPAVESKGGAGPVVVPVVRLGGTTTGTPFLESGASSPSGSLATQPAATGQPQALGDVVPAIPHLRLPKGGLYSIDTSATAPSLVVTDPKFLRDKEVKGLDYMLERLELDTQTTRKRVGDGSYESQLVAQQIVDLTGRPRLIPDCATAQGEFVTLMDNGLFHADSLQLKPGASLSVPQQDALAQPSVWPVQQMVTLSEGKEAAVLVPKVYLTKERTEALAPLGSALISAETMAGNLIGNLENSGTLLAERSIAITASGIENTGRMRTTGTDSSLILHAQKDLVHAGSIQGSRVELKADQDILMRASTREITGTTSSGTILDQIATVAADTLIASAGRDLKLAASQINTTGSASLTAERNVSLETVSTGYRKNLEYGRNHLRTSETGVVGVHLDVGGSAELKAGGDLAATAASVIAEQDLKASAGGNVTLATADQTLSVDLGRYHSGGSTFSSWSEQTRSLREARTSAGNLFSGDTVRVQVGDSMTVEGSTVVGARGVALDVAGDLEIKAATNTEHTSSFVHRKESGLLSGGGLGVSFGTREQKDEFDQHSSTQSQSRSRVGAIDGDLSITVGDRAQVLGSDLLAGKDIKIVAKDVAITPGLDQADRQERHEFKQTGVTLSLGGGAISMAQGIVSHVQAARESKGDPRAIALNALAAESLRHNLAERMDKVKEAMASSKAPKDMAAAAGIRVSVSIGTSQSVSESTERTLTHTGSTVHAGGNLSISATERDLKIRGAILDSRDMTLEAVRDLELTSAVDETSSRGSNSSSSSSVGVSFGIGQGRAGVSLDLALSRGHGDSHGDSAAHQYTLATAKGNLTLKSGGDTHVIGAQASGQAIESKVGGNLKMVSPQDTFKYASTQESVGVSASIPIGPGSGSASLNMSQSNTNSDSSSVREQSRIMAGEGGFQITVEGKTQLDGAVIDSIAGPKLNTLTTGALIVTDRKNHATGSSTTSGVGIGTDMFDSRSRSNMGRGLARTALDRGEASESDASTSRSAIAPGSINVTDDKAQMELTGKSSAQIVAEVRRDTEGTHRALARPDIARLEADANAERNLNTLAFDTGVIYAERIELARQRAGNTSGGGTITNPGTANQEQTGAADSTPALDPTGDEANLGIEVPVIATITAPSDELQAERSGSRAVVVIPAVVVEETNAHGVPTGVTSMQSDFGRSEPEAPGNESKAPINQRETGRSEPGANPDSIRTRGERYGSLTLDMQRIDQADSEPRPEYHSPVDRGYPTIYPEDPTLVASFNPFAVVTGAGDTGSDWARNNVTDPAERLKNKMRGLGWIEDRYIPDALSRIAAEDPARANEISRRIEADNEIARYAGLMGGGPRVLGPGRVPLSSGGLNLPNGGGVGALAPAVATGVVEVAVDAAAVAVPTAMAMAGNQQIGPGGNAPSDGPSTPSEPTTSSARETPPRHGEYKPAPRGDLSGPIQAERVPSQGGRATWKDAKGNTYQWDSLHGRLEKYNKHGKHLGEYDSATGAQTKPAKKDRSL